MSSLLSACPGCGLVLPSPDGAMDTQFNASWACRQLSGEVSAYTLTLGDADFLHQLVVDTYTAQHAGPSVKPIGITFALSGLLLTYERGYTGRQVQRAHMQLTKKSRVWPRFEPPKEKAALTVETVVQSPAGVERNAMIAQWGKSVWDIWQPEHANVRALVERTLYAE
jgi:Family of unknown function (DUF5946)